MVFGLNEFATDTYATPPIEDSEYWTEVCPPVNPWVKIVPNDAEILRCEDDAN